MKRPAFTGDKAPPQGMGHITAFVAIRIADKYGKRIPRPQELMSDWGMDRSTAYRWIASFKAARGIA